MTEIARSARLLWTVVRQDNPRRVAAALSLSVMVGLGSGPLVALWLKLIIDGVLANESGTVVVASLALAGSFVLQGIAGTLNSMLMSDLHESSALVLTQDLMRMALAVPGIEHHERPEYVDRISLLRARSRQLTGFLSTLGRALVLSVQIGATALLLASVHPALLGLPILAISSLYGGSRAESILQRAAEATAERGRLDEHLFGLVTNPATAKEVRVFNLGPELVTRRHQVWADVSDVMSRAHFRSAMVRTAGWLPFAIGYVATIALVVAQAAADNASAGDVLLVVTLASQVNGQVSQAVRLTTESVDTIQSVRRLLWLMDYSTAARQPGGEYVPVPQRLSDGIKFERVGFAYPGTGSEILTEVDLRLPAGSIVAMVGDNGAGKTTLVKLLSRCYEPTEGRILVDGVELRCLDVGAWRRRLSAAFQDFVRFEFLLRESVGIGDLGQMDNPRAVHAALARGQAMELSAMLPDGLETQLGKQFEGGIDLSQGQWQRVSISRAMMVSQPLLLMLDEPTSGLDAAAEHVLFKHYAAAARHAGQSVGAITLLISHRFSTVRLADLIVVLDHGRVVQKGTHDELITVPGLYAELYELQAKCYR